MAVTRIQHRRDSAAKWTSVNPVLAAGEFGVEKDTGRTKIGDGVKTWSDLPYTAPSEAELSATTVRRSFVPVMGLDTLPDRLNNEWRYQQSSYSQDNIVTLADGTQYAVWIRSDKHPIVGKRVVGSNDWQKFDLRTIAGDPFGEQAADGHNTFVLGVDPQGHVHVSGNMHGNTLRYARTTTPGNISAWTAPVMVGTNEDLVSYPIFFNAANGDLFFTYRNGGTSSGDTILNRRVGSTWQRVKMLMNGQVSNQNAYINRVGVGPDGSIHVMFMWRDEGEASTNADICYTYSTDGGATWKRSDGTAQPVPITRTNAEVVVNVEHASGLINQTGFDVDKNGHPHGVHMLYDANGNTQYHHVWHDGTVWHNDRVTDFTTRVETISVLTLELTTARPQIICTNEGRTYVLGMTQGDGWGGAAIIIDVTPGADNPITRLFNMDLARWEPSYDQRALKERGELVMLVTPLLSPAPANSGWDNKWGGILTVDTDRLDGLFSGMLAPKGTQEALTQAGIIKAGASLPPAVLGALASSTDMNTLRTPGTWKLDGPGRTYANLPTEILSLGASSTAQQGFIRVETPDDRMTIQTVMTLDGTYVGSRTRDGGTWTAWKRVGGGGGVTLASNTDLLTLGAGRYHIESSKGYINRPADFTPLNTSGVLEVAGYSGAVTYARLTTLDGLYSWENRAVNGVYVGWVRTRSLMGNGAVAAGGVDLFTLPNGAHHLVSGSMATYVNAPAALVSAPQSAILEIVVASTSLKLARITTADRTKAWEVTYVGSTWGSWVQTRGV